LVVNLSMELFLAQIESMCQQQPQKTALTQPNSQLTYAQLWQQSTHWAQYLKDQGFEPGQRVLLGAHSTIWSLVAMLGILRAQLVYVPVDPTFPAQRVRFMAQDTQAVAALGIAAQALDAPDLHIVENIQQPPAVANQAPLPPPAAKQLAYIMYTSGSTGKPKGVPVAHGQITHLLHALTQVLPWHSNTHYLLCTSIAFDASVKQLFAPLMLGATLYFYPLLKDLEGLAAYISQNHIYALHFTPTVWQRLLPLLAKHKENGIGLVSSGGEALPPTLANALLQQFPQATVFNIYGPTEACVNALYAQITPENAHQPPLGLPLPGYQAHVVNKAGNLQPPGAVGQLRLAGPAVSQLLEQQSPKPGSIWPNTRPRSSPLLPNRRPRLC